MANDGRRPVAQVRRVVAWVIGTVAVFITLFGAGSESWAVAALGVALLVLAVSLVLVSAVRGGARAWIAGTAHVVSATEPPASSTFGRCELQVVIDAPGLPAAAVKIIDPRVPVGKWPDRGATLPIMVAVDDPRHVRILWDEVLTHAEAAAGVDYAEPDILVVDDLDLATGVAPAPPAPRVEVHERVVPTEPVAMPVDEASPDAPPPGPDPVSAGATTGGGDDATVRGTGPGTTPPPVPPHGGGTGPVPRPRKPSPRPVRRRDPATGADRAGGAEPPRPPAPPPREPPDAADPSASAANLATADGPGAADGLGGADGLADGLGVADGVAGATATVAATTATARAGTVLVERPAGGAPPPHRSLDADLVAGDDEDGVALAERIGTYQSASPGPTGSIHGVGVTVLVADLERSIAFYRDMLGFQAIDAGDGNAVLASGDTRLVLHQIRDAAPVNRRMVHLNLEVGDLQAVYEDLRSRGVRFTYGPRPVNRGERLELWAAAFRDPDGHGIALTQWKGRPAERDGSAEDAAPRVQHVRPGEGKHHPDHRKGPVQEPGE